MSVADMPFVGRAETIAFFALAHILFANLTFGGLLIALFAQWRWQRRGDRRYERLAYTLARLNALGFTLVAALAIVLILLFSAVWPAGWAKILDVYFWPLVWDVFLFLLEGALLLRYLHTWPAAQRSRHLFWGAGAALAGAGSLLIINSTAAALFAPAPGATALAGGGLDTLGSKFAALPWHDPTWLSASLYRLVGAVSFAGLAGALVVAVAQRRARQPERRAHLTWLAGLALRLALLPLLALPLVGLYFVWATGTTAPQALAALVVGNLRWAFGAEMVLLALLFVVANLYVVRALRAARGEVRASLAMQWTLLGGMLAVALGALAAWYGSSESLRAEWDNWGVVGLLVILYGAAIALVERVAGGERGASSAAALLPFIVVCTLVPLAPIVQPGPSDFFLTQLWPWQVAALVGLVGLTLPMAALYVVARPALARRKNEPFSALAVALAGLGTLLALFVLGYVRDVAVGAYVIFARLSSAADVFAAPYAAAPWSPSPALALPPLALGLLLLAVLGWLILRTAPAAEPARPLPESKLPGGTGG